MAISPLQKNLIPNRSRKCAKTGHLFQPGDEYITRVTDGHDGELLREDILYSWWKEEGSAAELEECKSHWRGKVHESKVKDQSELLQKALDLFHTAYEEKQEMRAFLLALFLARKKVILFRQELQHEQCLYYLYEVVGGEEVLTVKVMTPTAEEMKQVQHELECELT